MTTDNPYQRLTADEMVLCKPLLTGDEFQAIPLEVHARVFHLMGEGPKARVLTDLEHLQVADYGAFEGLSEGQRKQISDLHVGHPIHPEEMVFSGTQVDVPVCLARTDERRRHSVCCMRSFYAHHDFEAKIAKSR